MFLRQLLLVLTLFLVQSHVHAQGALNYPSIWRCEGANFSWYCDEELQPKTTEPAPAPAKPLPTTPTQAGTNKKRLELHQIKTAEELRAEIKRREDLAIMTPTNANIRDYLEANAYMLNKGSLFADQWRRVVWQNPDLDYAQKRPVNNTANRAYLDDREKKLDEYLASLGKAHGLIFFYRSDCPYCHAMAPTVQLLQQKYGIEVLFVSTDGKPLPGLNKLTVNRGQFEALLAKHNLKEPRVPALFIGSKETGDTAPIGLGTMSLSEIAERIYVLTNTQPGSEF
jgi:conjugal transfer pilus assembly protein TraF